MFEVAVVFGLVALLGLAVLIASLRDIGAFEDDEDEAENFAVLADVRKKVEHSYYEGEGGREAKNEAAARLAAWAETQPPGRRRLYLKWIAHFQRENARRAGQKELFRRADEIQKGLGSP